MKSFSESGTNVERNDDINESSCQFIHDQFQICAEHLLLGDPTFLKGFSRSAGFWLQFDLRKHLIFFAG